MNKINQINNVAKVSPQELSGAGNVSMMQQADWFLANISKLQPTDITAPPTTIAPAKASNINEIFGGGYTNNNINISPSALMNLSLNVSSDASAEDTVAVNSALQDTGKALDTVSQLPQRTIETLSDKIDGIRSNLATQKQGYLDSDQPEMAANVDPDNPVQVAEELSKQEWEESMNSNATKIAIGELAHAMTQLKAVKNYVEFAMEMQTEFAEWVNKVGGIGMQRLYKNMMIMMGVWGPENKPENKAGDSNNENTVNAIEETTAA